MSNENQPAAKLRDGAITVTIWRNEHTQSDETKVHYSAVLSRSYKDKNDEWQNTDQLSSRELLKASRLLEKAYDEILTLTQQ